VIHGKTISERSLVVREIRPADATNCHLLFISIGDARPVGVLQFHGASVLTVVKRSMADEGGMIHLIPGNRSAPDQRRGSQSVGLRISPSC
jgi:hypothetical protein